MLDARCSGSYPPARVYDLKGQSLAEDCGSIEKTTKTQKGDRGRKKVARALREIPLRFAVFRRRIRRRKIRYKFNQNKNGIATDTRRGGVVRGQGWRYRLIRIRNYISYKVTRRLHNIIIITHLEALCNRTIIYRHYDNINCNVHESII